MSKKQWGFRQVAITMFNLVSLIYDGLRDSGSENPDGDIEAYVGAPYSKRLGEFIFSDMLVECWKTQVVGSRSLSELIVLKARRDLSMHEVEKITKVRGLTVNYLAMSGNPWEALEGLLAVYPECKITVTGMIDGRGTIPIVSGSTQNVIGWRQQEDGISKGERIVLARVAE